MPSFLAARQNPLDNVKTTFSSWDNCMAKVYCKWPVIIGIVVGSLIIFSVVACIAKCICCAGEAACCCFRCCTCCCGGSGRGRGSGHKRMNSDPKPAYPPAYPAQPYGAAPYGAPPPVAPSMDARPINQQYRANPMPTFNPAPVPERSQFATFDSSRKPANPDALPPMPTWGEARRVRVEVEEEEPAPIPQKRGDMEMDRLNHNGSAANTSMSNLAAGGAVGPRQSPGPGRPSPGPRGGDGYGYGHEDEFADPYNRPYAQQDEYRRGSPGPGPGRSPVYGGAGGAPRGYDRQSPAPGAGRSPVYGGGAREFDRQSPAPGQGRSPVYGGAAVGVGAAGYARQQSPAPAYPDHHNDHQDAYDTYSDPYHQQQPSQQQQRFARSRSRSPLHDTYHSPHGEPYPHSPHDDYTTLRSPVHPSSSLNVDTTGANAYAHLPDHRPTIPSYSKNIPAYNTTEPARFANEEPVGHYASELPGTNHYANEEPSHFGNESIHYANANESSHFASEPAPISPVAAAYPGQRQYNASPGPGAGGQQKQTYQAFRPGGN